MQKLTASDLRSLKWGDRVYRMSGNSHRPLRFVAVMPGSSSYLIFCDGEYLTHLYINEKDDTFRDDWYSGEYDSKVVGNIMKEYYLDKIKMVELVYLKD